MRVANTLKMFGSENYLGVKYSRTEETKENWGDALNSYLLPRISGRSILHFHDYYNLGLTPTLAGIGSILDHNYVRNLIVWGSGFKKPTAVVKRNPTKVLAVRGQLTRKRLLELGINCPSVYGDPALVLPMHYRPSSRKIKYRVGIVPHYVDKNHISLEYFEKQHEVAIIDVFSGIESFVDKICECEVIVSSSLHGLIAADAYDIPRVWVKISDKIVGGSFKFRDYFSSTDIKEVEPAELGEIEVSDLMSLALMPTVLADVNALLEAFPYGR